MKIEDEEKKNQLNPYYTLISFETLLTERQRN